MINGKRPGIHPDLDEPLPEWAVFALRRLEHSPNRVTYLGQPLRHVILYNDMLKVEHEQQKVH